jgi:hypothetical protein
MSGCARDGSDCVLATTVTAADGAVAAANLQLLAVPGLLQLPQPPAAVSFAVGVPEPGGAVPIRLTATAPALLVTLFTQANGRFSDNFLPLLLAGEAGATTLRFLPFGPLDFGLLVSTLRVEHLQRHWA